MYKVTFEAPRKPVRELGVVNSMDECYKLINQFLEQSNYKSYYMRGWKDGERIKIDVGSWSEFFYIEEAE